MKHYLATYINGTSTLQHQLLARDLKTALLSAAELTPQGFRLSGCVNIPEW